MEKEEFFYFVLLSAGVIALWYFVVDPLLGPPGRPARPLPQEERVAEEGEGEPAPEPTVPPPEAESLPVEAPEEQLQKPQHPVLEELELGNEFIKTYWTSKGAALQRVELLQYDAPYKVGDRRPVLTLVRDFQKGHYSDLVEKVTFKYRAPQGDQEASVDRSVAEVVYKLLEETDERLVFEGDLGGGLKVVKTVSIEPKSYHVDVTLQFVNDAERQLKFRYYLRGPAGIEREIASAQYLGTRVGVRKGPNDYEVTKRSAVKIAKGGKDDNINKSANLVWAGVASHYFVAVTLAQKGDWIEAVESRTLVDEDLRNAQGRWEGLRTIRRLRERLQREPHRADLESKLAQLLEEQAAFARSNPTVEVVLHSADITLQPHQSFTRHHKFITAPKQDAILQSYGAGMKDLIDFGWFPTLSRILLGILKAFHSLIPNYGVAILLLTLLVRGALHPLTRKSQIGMAKMQKLQPKIAELKKKYANDKAKLGQEQMRLFRKYGVSPLGGCLPMFLQLPVFFALFGTLRAAIELRQAGFLWVADLSGPDTILHFPFSLPVLKDELNVLPFLMGTAMVLNQRLMPRNPDPQSEAMQKPMKWMMYLFPFLLYHMPSGLNLYIATSTFLGILEQHLVRKHLAKMELELLDEGGAEKGKKKSSPKKPEKMGLFGKLLDAVERQQRESRKLKSRKRKNG